MLDEHVSCEALLFSIAATGCECHGTTLPSAGRIPRMKRSMKEVPGRINTARCRAITIQKRVFRLSSGRWRNINLSRNSGCMVAVCRSVTSLRLIQLVQTGGIMDK